MMTSSRGALLFVALACTGCPQVAITKAATTVVSASADDRSYDQQIADGETKASIEKVLVENSPKLAADVNVDVFRRRVMLTGAVVESSLRRDAVAMTRSVVGNGIVYDDIQVVPAGQGSAFGAGFVENEDLGARLLAADGIGSQSFLHRVVNGVAYIIGEAHQARQVEIARETALGTSGIHDVVTHIEIRP